MNRRIQPAVRALVATALLSSCLAVSACQTAGDDPYAKASLAAITPGQKYDVPHYDAGPMPTYFRFDQVPDPWSAVTIDVCKAYTTPQTPPNSQPTRDCICTNCLDWVHQCDALDGCREIVQCAAQVGCNSIITCYLLPQPTAKDPSGKACQAVIDKWGNSGFAAYLANRIQECSSAASCPLPP